MNLHPLVLRVFAICPFSFRFRKLATTAVFVFSALSSAPLWANPLGEKGAIERSSYMTVIGGRLGNGSDTTFSANPDDEKIGNLQPLKPGSDADFRAVTLGHLMGVVAEL